MTTPASQLLGRTLPGGWTVIKTVVRPPTATGGNFSVGYIVESEKGIRGYLKALDYSAALKSLDPARALEAMTAAYNFERDLLHKCNARKLDRIVVSLADGSVTLDTVSGSGVVQYLIFELADGDVRSRIANVEKFDVAWALRTLHHVAIGLQQLHREDIAHQDLKPSNVLLFRGGVESKIGDWGRAAYKGHSPLTMKVASRATGVMLLQNYSTMPCRSTGLSVDWGATPT